MTLSDDISASFTNVSLSTGGLGRSPAYSRSAATRIGSFTGAFVYSALTSKDTSSSSFSSSIVFTISDIILDEEFICASEKNVI